MSHNSETEPATQPSVAAGQETSETRAAAELSEQDMHALFVQLAEYAVETGNDALGSAAAAMVDLLAVAVMFRDDESTQQRAEEILEFCRHSALPALTQSDADTAWMDMTRSAMDRWSDLMELLAPQERFEATRQSQWTADGGDGWQLGNDHRDSAGSQHEQDESPLSPVDLSRILSSIDGNDDSGDDDDDVAADSENLFAEPVRSARPNDAEEPATLPAAPSQTETIDDAELLAAYADDAVQCLAEMEASLLKLDNGKPNQETLRNFCRQLHTLKGASGTVGLSRLAAYLHDVESWLESTRAETVSTDRLLECVDAVRAQLTALGVSTPSIGTPVGSDVPEPARSIPEARSAARPAGLPAGPAATVPSPSDGEIFVRVDASRLERLMDLLAELVMLRNRRESHVDFLRNVQKELNLCASRARSLTSTMDQAPTDGNGTDTALPGEARRQTSHTRFLARSLDEVARDTAELSRSLQEVFEPLSTDNSAVSHLIGRFRQELMELRRLPVSALFQRLQRSIRDAARAEGKQVSIVQEGQGARAERAVQERLFEPLLHLVRNAVSHGIQLPEERVREGKGPAGTITLAAWSDAASLCLEIRDDGRGLNDMAIEARGRELGLLPPGEVVSQAQIRQLIFHPGFSTKSSVSEISGRGVGMDVVDNWVRRLRGRIDVESTAGQGTTFRLQIPLRSAVEHAMIVRAGRQLFALPMHSVSGTSDAKIPMSGSGTLHSHSPSMRLARLLGIPHEEDARTSLISLRTGDDRASGAARRDGSDLTLEVDAIVGVEEVVVRSLPPLLQHNELFVGVTLSGRAETVLLLDSGRLLDLIHRNNLTDDSPARTGEVSARPPGDFRHEAGAAAATHDTTPAERVLIVDDSVVVRRSLARKLADAGYDTCEAAHGKAALKLLRAGGIAGVVTDVDMPGMNGVELLQEMKRSRLWQSIPVVVLSSRDEESMPSEMAELSPDAVLTKPVSDDTIVSIVQTLSAVNGVAT